MSSVAPAAPDNPRSRSVYSEELLETLARWRGIDAKPDPENRRKRNGIQIFRSRLLELGLTKSPWYVPWLFSIPIMTAGLWWGAANAIPAWQLGLAFLTGILLWTFLEYVLHRWLFHHQPKSDTLKVFFFLTHGYHHEFPDDPMRLVAPPLMYWSLATFFAAVFFLVFGPVWWAPLYAGMIGGYLFYDSVHYYVHHSAPKSGIGKFLRSYHLLHHFDDHDTRYGISTPLWDFVFRTYRPLGKTQSK